MTLTLKRPSSNAGFDFIFSLLILALLFVFASFLDPNAFFILAFGLLILLIYLGGAHQRLLQDLAKGDWENQDLQERVNVVQAQIIHEERAVAAIKKNIVNYGQLKDLTEKLSACLSLDETVKVLTSQVPPLVGKKEATMILYLFHSKTGELGIKASHKGELRVNLKAKKGDIFDQWVAKTLQTLLVEDSQADYRFDTDKMDRADDRSVRSLMSVPLVVGDRALGILRMDMPEPRQFTTDDLRFLRTIGDLSALAIENAQLYEHVEALAIRDGLTGLYLRRHLLERLSEEIARHQRRHDEMSLLIADIDHFKQYNDKYGHTAGDIVLKTVAKLLQDAFAEPGDIVCRYGGEEFAVLLPGCSKVKAAELAEVLRQKVQQQTIFLRREKTQLTISVGVAAFPDDALGKEELIHKADQALYRAKAQGRNRVCEA